MRGTPAEKLNLATAQNVAEVLRDHVVLELEGIDRMYLNVFVPVLQAVEGVLKFIRIHRGHPVASTAMVEPITRSFVTWIERYVPSLSSFDNCARSRAPIRRGRLCWRCCVQMTEL
jgi:hypothetical protein